jgi:hypothetical protein
MTTQLQSAPRLPSDQNRLAIVGATGTGKTQAAQWHLSHRRYDVMPWIVYNFKADESIDSIPYIREVGLDELPTQPGVYVARPLPDLDDEAVDHQMRAIWKRGNIGVWVDEGYMISPRNRSFQMLLTQGRSKNVPMIVLSQRPVWMNRFVFSESEFYQVFRLQHRKDRETMAQIVPADFDNPLPPYHSWYYDAAMNRVSVTRPVPDLSVIHNTFARRLSVMEYRRKRVV